MKYTLAALVAATMFIFSFPANADWKCRGADYVCNGNSYKVNVRPNRVKVRTKRVRVNVGPRGVSVKVKKKKYYKRNKKRTYKKKSKRRTYKKYAKSGRTLHGKASYYWQPQGVACHRGRFNPNALTAAHKSLPCGTRVRVTNKRNGRSVTVKINDRGPYIKGRIIDLSKRAAGVIGMQKAGVVPVKVTVLR